MLTIGIQRLEGSVHVMVSRWPRSGRYPVVLSSFSLIDSEAESELALIERACLAVVREVNLMRREL
jgi:hypothetical protein